MSVKRDCQCDLQAMEGVDIQDIKIIVQWRANCTPSMFWQQIGRGTRDPGMCVMAILFVESKHFDVDARCVEENQKKRWLHVVKKRYGMKKRCVSIAGPLTEQNLNLPVQIPARLMHVGLDMMLVDDSDDSNRCDGSSSDGSDEGEDNALWNLEQSLVLRRSGEGFVRCRRSVTAKLDDAIAALINADQCLCSWPCWRHPIAAVFNNASVGVYLHLFCFGCT